MNPAPQDDDGTMTTAQAWWFLGVSFVGLVAMVTLMWMASQA